MTGLRLVRFGLKKQPKQADNLTGNVEGIQYEMTTATKRGKSEQAVTISAAAKITGIEVHTLRYWEREFGEFLNPNRTQGGQRRYRPVDIQTVFLIKRFVRDEMFSIAGARRAIKKHFEDQIAA